jgi:uncharacterized protein YqiB (DUF1249 family)
MYKAITKILVNIVKLLNFFSQISLVFISKLIQICVSTISQDNYIAENIFEMNYFNLISILHNIDDNFLNIGKDLQLISSLSENYSVQLVASNDNHYDISITHYFLQNGDLIPDPEFVLRVYPIYKMVEVLQYQDKFGIQKAYFTNGRINPDVKIKLNRYFGKWLDRLEI